ncbi:hypothetical protein [Sporomusa termitida]|uniref:ECF transporter S component n=1 Tax=Sporomusa termitida TaxID=2377 RepID=A0A517DUI0_9FIRM|nr:hypothetical protein [Sporomusa termitida]QDR81005.1 hypothetical protein SPTER_23600 [Sporomusa termitida]
MSEYRGVTRAALLLALTLIFQSLRFFIPLPPFLSTFLIGSLVNATLLIAAEKTGLWPALMIAAIAPVVAYFQQLLSLPLFILPVACGNMVYVGLFLTSLSRGRVLAIALGTVGKAGLLYGAFVWLLTVIAVPPKPAAAIMLAMSWPQLITGALGGLIATAVAKRLK